MSLNNLQCYEWHPDEKTNLCLHHCHHQPTSGYNLMEEIGSIQMLLLWIHRVRYTLCDILFSMYRVQVFHQMPTSPFLFALAMIRLSKESNSDGSGGGFSERNAFLLRSIFSGSEANAIVKRRLEHNTCRYMYQI